MLRQEVLDEAGALYICLPARITVPFLLEIDSGDIFPGGFQALSNSSDCSKPTVPSAFPA